MSRELFAEEFLALCSLLFILECFNGFFEDVRGVNISNLQFIISYVVNRRLIIAKKLTKPKNTQLPGAVPSNAHSLHNDVRTLLPNLVGLFRGIQNMRRPTQGNIAPNWNHNLGNPAGNLVPIAHGAANQQSRDCLVTPGTTLIGIQDRN